METSQIGVFATMPWMDWIGQKHSLFVHIPTVAALLLPVALMAAQRPGRGIKPWWITCRYLAWAGALGSIPAVLSGLQIAYRTKLLMEGQFISKGGLENPTLFQLHQWLAVASFVLGVLTLRALYRKREEHQGIGVLGLFMGTFWAVSAVAAAYFGQRLGHPVVVPPVQNVVAPQVVPPKDPEATVPFRALDYHSLTPMHVEPVKSAPHGNRWVRVWANAKAAEAYRDGQPLPNGSLVVMNSLEDRWGRPGFEPGPLYALEVNEEGKPSLLFYWARVPEARRNETRGLDRAYWRGQEESLRSCLDCHGNGVAPAKDRSKWVVPRPKPKTDAEEGK